MCLFCDIIEGKIPSYKVYEDEYTYAFLDIANDIEGHTLVVSKEHCENILDASNETLSHIMDSVKKISNHYLSLGYTGVNIINNSGKDAEQSVMHLHFHILPRKENDKYEVFPKFNKLDLALDEVASKLKLN